MPIAGKYFPSQRTEEKVFLLLRRHWFTYISFLIIALIMSAPIFILLFFWLSNPESFSPVAINISILAVSVYSLFIIALLLYGFIDYYLDVYIVTNERIVDVTQDGFFRRSISELYLREVQDVSAQVKGFFPTMIHYGEITIQTAGERPNFIFRNVPSPYRISKIIVDLHEAAVERRPKLRGIDVQPKIAAKIIEKDGGESDFQIDLSTAALARERTKEFISGEELQETPLPEEAGKKIETQKSTKVLTGLNNSVKENRRDNKGKKPSKKLLSKKTAKTKSEKSKKSVKTSISGEMHENEEIDI